MDKQDSRFKIIYLVVQNRFLIIKNVLIFSLIASIISLVFFPNWYKSTAKIILPENQNIGLGSFLTDVPFSDMIVSGIGSNTSLDNIVGIIESRTVKDNIIKKFNLDSVYKFDDDYYYEDLIDEFSENIIIDVKYDQNIIVLSVTDTDPILATEIVNYYVRFIDTTINELYSSKAKENRIFLKNRIDETESELNAANLAMENFQQRTALLSLPDQMKITVEAIGGLYTKLSSKEITRNILYKTMGPKSPEFRQVSIEIREIKKKLNELVSSENPGDDSFIALKKYPSLSVEYYNLFKEITIKEKLLEFLYPQFEQAKLEEQKKLSNILILDEAIPPEKKSFPHRSYYIIGIALLITFLTVSWIILADKINTMIYQSSPDYLTRSVQLIGKDISSFKYWIFRRSNNE